VSLLRRAPVAVEPMIKGAGIAPFLTWYARTRDASELVGLVDGLPPHIAGVFDAHDEALGVIASAWYPAPSAHALLDGIMAGRSEGEWKEIARQGAHAVVASTLRGVYRWLFETMMSPERYAKNAQKLFSRYFNTGIIQKTTPAPRQHLSVIRDWTSHHPMLCELLIRSGEYIYPALGCTDVVLVKQACVSEGGDECRFAIRWK
jgi:hypothetical protein